MYTYTYTYNFPFSCRMKVGSGSKSIREIHLQNLFQTKGLFFLGTELGFLRMKTMGNVPWASVS